MGVAVPLDGQILRGRVARMKNEFFEIGICNDWASETYYVGPANPGGFPQQDQSRRIQNGDRLEVQWPNGTVEEAIAIIESRPTSYSDMGVIRHTRTEELFFGFKDEKRGSVVIPVIPNEAHRRFRIRWSRR